MSNFYKKQTGLFLACEVWRGDPPAQGMQNEKEIRKKRRGRGAFVRGEKSRINAITEKCQA